MQILLDNFNVRGIVHYGIAGSVDDSLSLGDVSIPRFLAFTGSWTWTVRQLSSLSLSLSLSLPLAQLLNLLPQRFKYGDKDGEEKNPAELIIGAFNTPLKGQNLLSNIEFNPEEFFSVGQEMKKIMWMETFPPWFHLAQKLEVWSLNSLSKVWHVSSV